MRVAVAVLFLAAVCAAQMPERAELLKEVKYAEEAPKPEFKTYSEADLKSALQILSTRSYAVYGFNTPEVRLVLPKVGNSSYASIEFAAPTLLNAAGRKVPFETEESGYMEDSAASEIRFKPKTGDAIVQFAHVKGTVKLKYPLSVQTQTFTTKDLGDKTLGVIIDGPYVSFGDEAFQVPSTSFSHLRPIRAYDKDGKQLEQAPYSETSADDDMMRQKMAFFGNVARLEIDTAAEWAELDLPYDLKPAPMLPKGHEGEDPASYKQ